MISDHVVFSSSHFPIVPGEDEETNPGIYGKALADWVARQLRLRGVPVETIIAEDFGRCVMVKRRPFLLWVACASLDDTKDRWQMFISLEFGWLARFFGRADPAAELERLRTNFRALVTEVPGVRDIEWQDP